MRAQMPTARSAGWKVPVACRITPIIQGAAKPDKLPIDTTIAMPTAAVLSEKLSLIPDRNGPLRPNVPIAETDSAIMVTTGETIQKQAAMPMAETKAAIAVCQVRSRVVSECLAQ